MNTEMLGEAQKRAISNLPNYMQESAILYLTEGRPTGSFLNAVLENDLHKAIQYADQVNLTMIFQWAAFLNAIPLLAWGSPDKVDRWIKAGGMQQFSRTGESA